MVRTMTGPEGALELAHAEDAWTRADWEKATAAVLRKSRRMSEEDADSLVWDKLTRKTLDGLDITPLGTPSSLEGLATAGRPARAGDWDVRSLVEAGPEKQLNEAALVDLDGGVTSLWLQLDAGADLATLLQGVLLDLAPVALDAADPLAAAQAFLDHAGDTDLASRGAAGSVPPAPAPACRRPSSAACPQRRSPAPESPQRPRPARPAACGARRSACQAIVLAESWSSLLLTLACAAGSAARFPSVIAHAPGPRHPASAFRPTMGSRIASTSSITIPPITSSTAGSTSATIVATIALRSRARSSAPRSSDRPSVPNHSSKALPYISVAITPKT